MDEQNQHNKQRQSFDEMVAAARAAGGREVRPNGLPVVYLRCDGTMMEHPHADDPNYLFPVEVDGPSPYHPNLHALIYANDFAAVTLYEHCYFLWSVRDGTPNGGSIQSTEERLSPAAIAAIQHHLAQKALKTSPETRSTFMDGLLDAMVKSLGIAAGDWCPKAARTDEELRVAFDRWKTVGVHGITGLALYHRGPDGAFVFDRFATQEEDDAFIRVHQTSLASLMVWRAAAESAAEAQRERDEAIAAARREGAEAMREACAKAAEHERTWDIAVRIRALPTTGGKP